jgi:hypothetical protein
LKFLSLKIFSGVYVLYYLNMEDQDITGCISRIGTSNWYKIESAYNPTIYFDINNIQGFLFDEKGVEGESDLIEKRLTVLFNNGIEKTVLLVITGIKGVAFQFDDEVYYKTVEDLEKILETSVKE